MGGRVIHLGGIEQAAVTKVVTNMLAFIHLIAAGEALMLCAKGGVDLRAAFDAIAASSGNSFVHETESQVILNGSYDIGFTMDLACKDAGFAVEFGAPVRRAAAARRRDGADLHRGTGALRRRRVVVDDREAPGGRRGHAVARTGLPRAAGSGAYLSAPVERESHRISAWLNLNSACDDAWQQQNRASASSYGDAILSSNYKSARRLDKRPGTTPNYS